MPCRKVSFQESSADPALFLALGVLTQLTQQFDKVLLIYLLPTNEIGFYMVASSSASVNHLCVIARYRCLHQCRAEKSKNRFSGADDSTETCRATLHFRCDCFRSKPALAYIFGLWCCLYNIGSINRLNTVARHCLNRISRNIKSRFTRTRPPHGRYVCSYRWFNCICHSRFVLGKKVYGVNGIAISYVIGESINLIGMLIIVIRFYRDVRRDCFIPRYDDINFVWRKLIRR